MSIKMMVSVYEADLPKNEKAIALKYADFSDDDGHGIYPSVARVAWETGYSDRSVQIITDRLVKRGVLVLIGTHPAYGTNEYRMNRRALPERPSWNEYISQRRGGGEVFSGGGEETSGGGEIPSPGHRVKFTTVRGEDSSPDPLDNHITNSVYKRTPEYLPEPVHQLITALSAISKTPYWPKTEGDYSDAAYFLVGVEANVEDIPKFSTWWAENGYYQGKPALKTIVDEWQNFIGGHKSSASVNGNGNGRSDLWITDGLPYRVGSKRFTDLDPKAQDAIRKLGGQSVFKAGGQFEETRLRTQFLQLVQP